MDALANAVDVARICGIPERRDVALVGFRGEEKLERDVGGRGRVREEGVRLVVRLDGSAQVAQPLRLLLVRIVLLCETCRWRLGGWVFCGGRRAVKTDAGVPFALPLLLEVLGFLDLTE